MHFLFQAVELSKTYPNFINYFEKTKEAISYCDRTKPRFHAFLRVIFLTAVWCFFLFRVICTEVIVVYFVDSYLHFIIGNWFLEFTGYKSDMLAIFFYNDLIFLFLALWK